MLWSFFWFTPLLPSIDGLDTAWLQACDGVPTTFSLLWFSTNVGLWGPACQMEERESDFHGFPALPLAHCGTFCVSVSPAIKMELVVLSLPFLMCKTSSDGRYNMREGLGTCVPSLASVMLSNHKSLWLHGMQCAQHLWKIKSEVCYTTDCIWQEAGTQET